ncbi:MAG: Rrf2 family transcriptional regulator [Phycisphaerales bacterium]
MKPEHASGAVYPTSPHRLGYGRSVSMFSSTSEYALRAAVHLASLHGEPATSERIAEATKVPPGYISKVMRDLVVAEIVSSQRGPNGGFTLARPPESITVLDVVNAVTPIQRIRSCPLGNPAHVHLCPLHKRLDDAIAGIEAAFASTTIAQLVAPDQAAGERCGALTVDRRASRAAKRAGG